MNLKKLKIASAVVALTFAANSAFAGPPASIEQHNELIRNNTSEQRAS